MHFSPNIFISLVAVVNNLKTLSRLIKRAYAINLNSDYNNNCCIVISYILIIKSIIYKYQSYEAYVDYISLSGDDIRAIKNVNVLLNAFGNTGLAIFLQCIP